MIKLSFSINGWKDYTWQDFTELASEIGFKGIELHNAMESNLTEKDGPFHKYNSAATIRKLADDGINIVQAGHYHTEAPVLSRLADLCRRLAGAECLFFDSNPIKTV